MSLLSRIDEWARQTPHRVAHSSSAGVLTWGELARRSDALAGALSDLTPGSPVVLRGHKEPEMLVGFLGCAKAAHPYIPVDIGVPEARAQRVVEVSGAELVLTPQDVREMESRGRRAPAPTGDANTPHYVIFTSGSTGDPKGVVITRGCLDAFLRWMLDEQRFAHAGETFLNQALFSFDLSVMDTWCSLATGSTIFSLTTAEIEDFRRLFVTLAGAPLTTWVSTPTFAQLCLAERRFNEAMLPQVRRFLFCGDVLTPEVAEQLLTRFPRAEVWNTYGPTEATCATTSIRIDHELLRRYPQLPIGRAMPGTKVTVEGDGGEPVPDGDRGEIIISGPNVSPGYLGRPDLTERAFSVRDGVRTYRTGDWGSVRDGLLFFHGRRDDQVKIAGHRIEPGDVEVHLASLPRVRQAAVVPAYRDGRIDSLHAFVVLSGDAGVSADPSTSLGMTAGADPSTSRGMTAGADPSTSRGMTAGADPSTSLGMTARTSALEIGASIRKELAAQIPTYMLPRKVHVLEQLPLTPNGKTDRRALAARVQAPSA
jgi:D-alanine--poly(phosphoribitol) ligase subunit 1